MKKRNVKALKYIDYARHLRICEIRKLLKYELSPASLYLTNDKIRKIDRYDLTNVLHAKLEGFPIMFVPFDVKRMTVFFDFMTYACKVATDKLKRFGDFVVVLCKTISLLSKTYTI